MNTKHTRLPLALVLSLCVAVVACGGNGTEIVRVDATKTPALPESTAQMDPALAQETSTRAVDPIPAPTSAAALPGGSAVGGGNVLPPVPVPFAGGSVLDDLQEELAVSFGGGSGPVCAGSRPTGPLPEAVGDVYESHLGFVCLWGFPTGRAVNVELYDPSGQFVAARELTVDAEMDGIGFVHIPLTFAGQPTGDWTLVANSADMSLKAPFHVGEPHFPIITVVPAGSDVFSGPGLVADLWQNIYAVDDDLSIFGAGFPPGRSLPLGIYYKIPGDWDDSELVCGQVVQADGQGRFEVHWPVDALALRGEGIYYAVAVLDPSYEFSPLVDSPLGDLTVFVVASGADDAGSVALVLKFGGGRLDDPTVRQAIVAAVNRLHLSEYFGGAKVTFLFSFQGEVMDPAAEPWDPNLARQQLAQAGYPGGANAAFVYPEGDSQLDILAWNIADDLANVGLPVQPVPVSTADIDGYVSVIVADDEPVFWLARR